ncbi:MAG: hypothetical protein ABR866_01530 [Candidatus Korobacteraceae bacterium]|jgi:hypothetical protein
MTQNYMLVDIAETVAAAIVFSLIFLLPGVWQDPASWVWSREPLVSNDAIRIIPCGTSSSQSGSR